MATRAATDARRAAPDPPHLTPGGIRPEIQALRALAVLGVLLFHLWPLRLPGGYIGVDVFFVVSGFLITDHLVREYVRRGRISLPEFWARRVRRLLPASFLVLVSTAVAVHVLVPLTRWPQFGLEIIASAFYVENWVLAAQSVDYMALSNVKSPVQHFWTLGVEEQFYIVWPLLLIGGAFLAGWMRRSGLRGMAGAVVVATLASFVFSVVYTALVPTVAYFSTATRAWEFGAGALLALVLRRTPTPITGGVAAAASWVGFALLAIAMFLFTGATPFPSYTALLPVLGTVLVIVAGAPSTRWSPTALFSVRPVQFVGDVSYGVYLWHWPLIVLLPYALLAPLNTWQSVTVGAVSIALGWASKVFVEDPVRSHRWLASARPRRSFLAAGGGMLVVTAMSLPLALSTVPPPPQVPAALPACWGASAMTVEQCGGPSAAALRAPAPSFAVDLPTAEVASCELSAELATYRRCDLRAADGGRTFALVGDSHATRWVETFARATKQESWGLSTFLVSGCPLVSLEPLGSAWGYDPVGAQLCPRPTSAVIEEIVADPTITDVVLTNRTRLYVSDDPADRPLSPAAVAATIRMLQDAGKRVIVLADHPETARIPVQGGAGAPDCLTARDAEECTMPRRDADFADPMRAAAVETGAALIDLTAQFCDDERCHWQIGGLVVYTDDNHMTRSFAATLTPALVEALSTQRSEGR
ncbi:acyltransferase family protein [Microbacterium aurantiacum]|uniref:acyltransferase family protein n=1 Tax=Microbacterium aurantiacum TaxID=162393 RepID=UPI003F494A9E